MSDGMTTMFRGTLFWKMPPDVRMEIGPTKLHPLPTGYLEATERYASQVRVVDLPSGGLTLSNYRGGIPFPQPSEPHRGWKILANVWFRYLPHIAVDSSGTACQLDVYGNATCVAALVVYRQLAYNSDPGVPATIPQTEGKFFTLYTETISPEQQRYTASLIISYAALRREEQTYVFFPALRRSQAISASARCSPSLGTDATPDDMHGGFDSNMTQIEARYMGEQKILALLGFTIPPGTFPDHYDMPLGWPLSSWGKWQIRDVYVVSVSALPSLVSHSCYGKRIIYIDKASFAPLWEDIYDKEMQFWKAESVFIRTLSDRRVGAIEDSLSEVQSIWNFKQKHATFFSDPADRHPFYVNDEVPDQFSDVSRYTSPSGLSMIMR